MAVEQTEIRVTATVPVEIDLPEERIYERETAAELDRALVEAIDAAKTDGNDYLAQLLANELGSHYYETR